MKKTLVFGASLKPNRYSNLALRRLAENGIETVAFGRTAGTAYGIPVAANLDDIRAAVHTVTLYMRPELQRSFYQDILRLKPERVIFNPGAENPEFYPMLKAEGIEVLEACTLVLLAIGTY